MFTSQSLLDVPTAPAPSTEVGIMVLSMDGRILHINEQARDIAYLRTGGSAPLSLHPTTIQLPSPLLDLFHAVLANLEKHIAAEDWRQVAITRRIRSADGTVLLRGFGIPDQARRQQSRVVLTLHCHLDPRPL